MASNYWAKLWIEMLDDPKVARLDDHLWRRWVEMILLGKECDNCGFLPPTTDMAWRLRTTEAEMRADLEALVDIGLLVLEGEAWHVVNFVKRQDAMGNAERQRRYREQKRRNQYYGRETPERRASNEPVTDRNVDTETETDTEKETEQSTPAESLFCELFKPFIFEEDRADILAVEQTAGSDAVCEAIRWAKRKRIPGEDLIKSIVTAASKWNIGPPSTAPPPPKDPIVLDIDLEAQPDWIRT